MCLIWIPNVLQLDISNVMLCIIPRMLLGSLFLLYSLFYVSSLLIVRSCHNTLGGDHSWLAVGHRLRKLFQPGPLILWQKDAVQIKKWPMYSYSAFCLRSSVVSALISVKQEELWRHAEILAGYLAAMLPSWYEWSRNTLSLGQIMGLPFESGGGFLVLSWVLRNLKGPVTPGGDGSAMVWPEAWGGKFIAQTTPWIGNSAGALVITKVWATHEWQNTYCGTLSTVTSKARPFG